MPKAIATQTGFKFSIDGIKVQKTEEGKSYDIPENLLIVWADKSDYFKRVGGKKVDVDPEPEPEPEPSKPAAKKAKPGKEAK